MKAHHYGIVVIFLAVPMLSSFATSQNSTPYPCTAGGGGTWHCVTTYETSHPGQPPVNAGGCYDQNLPSNLACAYLRQQIMFFDLDDEKPRMREDCAWLGGFPCTTIFADGNMDAGEVVYDLCYNSLHMVNGLPNSDKSVNRDWPHCPMPTGSAWSSLTIYVDDEVFGSDIGGFVCVDLDPEFEGRPNSNCAEPSKGEFSQAFCGHTVVPHVPNYGEYEEIMVAGEIHQPIVCPTTANPVGGTTGSISAWIAPTTAPQCSDHLDNDGDGYTDWGYYGRPDRAPASAFTGNLGSGCEHIADNSE